MLSLMSITQRSAYCGCLRQEMGAALRLAMGSQLAGSQPTTLVVEQPVPERVLAGLGTISSDDAGKHKFSSILGWLNLDRDNWSSETRKIPSFT
jgi:hypothetical protein